MADKPPPQQIIFALFFTALLIPFSFFKRGIYSVLTSWFILDIFIVITWFKYGKEEMQGELGRKLFVPWTVVVLASCFVLQILFMVEFGDVEGEKYSAFLQNIAMSVAYLYMLNSRKSSRGQSMLIAVCKCIGTVTPTIFGTMEGNTFILVTGIICFIFDAAYIYCLHHVIRKEKTVLQTI